MVDAMQQLHLIADAKSSTAEFVAAFTGCVLESAACSLAADAKKQLSLAVAKQQN